MKYAGAVRLRVDRPIASPSSCPLGSRPSVSTVNEIATGIPASLAARATPIASSAYVIVIAVTMSAAVPAKCDLGRVIALRRLHGKQLGGVVAVVAAVRRNR